MSRILGLLFVSGGAAFLLLAGWNVSEATRAQRAMLATAPVWSGPMLEPNPPTPAVEPTWIPDPGTTWVPGPAQAPDTVRAPGPGPTPQFEQGEPLFRLEIPRIHLRNIVVYGSSEAALKRGPGLVERTPLPGGLGNSVISAHRDYYFWALGDLEPGDDIWVSTEAGILHYRVTGSRVVKETQTEILDPTPTPTLTLVTCWPLIYAGRTPDRLVVQANLITLGEIIANE